MIGLQQPITLYEDDDEIIHLVAGLHRLEAARYLGWDTIDAVYTKLSAVDRELWEISENLHRVDLSKTQRDEHIRRYAELLGSVRLRSFNRALRVRLKVNAPMAAGIGQKGAAGKSTNNLGISKKIVRAAIKVPDPDAEQKKAETKASASAQVKAVPPATSDDISGAAADVRREYAEHLEACEEGDRMTPHEFVEHVLSHGYEDVLTIAVSAMLGLPRDPWPGLTHADLWRMTEGRTAEARKMEITPHSKASNKEVSRTLSSSA